MAGWVTPKSRFIQRVKMSESVKHFAVKQGWPVEYIINILTEAGLPQRSYDDEITEEDRTKLLYFLSGKETDGMAKRKSTLHLTIAPTKRKTSSHGTVMVETRKKRPKFRDRVTLAKHDRVRKLIEEKSRQEKLLSEKKCREEETSLEAKRKQEQAAAQAKAQSEESQGSELDVSQVAIADGASSIDEVAGDALQEVAKPRIEEVAEQKPAVEKSSKAAVLVAKKEVQGELHLDKEKTRKRRPSKKPMPKTVRQLGDNQHAFARPMATVKRKINIRGATTVTDLAQKMAIKSANLLRALCGMGIEVPSDNMLEQDTAVLVAEEMGHSVVLQSEDYDPIALFNKDKFPTEEPESAKWSTRPPVVTVMGHVDHGKTTLLDYIRKSDVVSAEAGGITQHIGAYRVESLGKKITFLDTPGHEAFSAIRARGARLTDIIVLVVAADDGVKPQTVEGIQHAQQSSVPLIVAVNKVDKDEKDIQRVKRDLGEYGIIPEEWGGDHMFVEVSAKTGHGVDDLMSAILLQADVMDLKANQSGHARGVAVEAFIDSRKGVIVSLIVQEGTLKKWDFLLAGCSYGKVRALFDDQGRTITSATLSEPVRVLGLSSLPSAGDQIFVVKNERKAKEVANKLRQKRVRPLGGRTDFTIESFLSDEPQSRIKNLVLIVRADVHGSADAIKSILASLVNDKVNLNVLRVDVGSITASDIHLALASKAEVLGFNVRLDAAAQKIITERNIKVRYYSVIYDLIDDIKQMMEGLTEPQVRERILGMLLLKKFSVALLWGKSLVH